MLRRLLIAMVLKGCSKGFEFRPVSSTCAAVFGRDLLPVPTAAPSWNAPGAAWICMDLHGLDMQVEFQKLS